MRVLEAGGRIVNDPGLVSRELAPRPLKALWNQRMRWAQGWFQVSCRHLRPILSPPASACARSSASSYLLGLREVYPWISLLTWPLLGFLAWRDGGIDLASPIFLLLTLFVTVSGPLQTLAAWRLAAPGAAPAPALVRRRRGREPGLLHRAEEPREPRRPAQAAARRAPVGGHPAHRRPRPRTDHETEEVQHDHHPDPTRTLTHRPTTDAPTPRRTRLPARPGCAASPRWPWSCSTPTSTTAPDPSRAWPWSRRRAPADARHRPVRRHVLRAVRAGALAADRAGRARRRHRPAGPGAAVPPDGAAAAALLRDRADGLGADQPVPARPLAGPGDAPDLHPRLQRPVHLLDRRTCLVAGGGVPLLRADGARRPARHTGRTTRRTAARPPGRRVGAARRCARRSASPTCLGDRPRRPARELVGLFSPLSRGADFGIGMGLAVLVAAGVRLGARPVARSAVPASAALVVLVLAAARSDDVGRVVAPAVRARDRRRRSPRSCCTTARGRRRSTGSRWSGSAASGTAST